MTEAMASKRKLRVYLIGVPLGVLCLLWVWDHFRAKPGWRGSLYNSQDLTGPEVAIDTREIDFNWELQRPDPAINEDYFSARFLGCLNVDKEISYTFKLGSDDGARLLIDSAVAIDNWNDHSFQERMTEKILDPGNHLLTVEYYEATTNATLKFSVIGTNETETSTIVTSPTKAGTCM